MLAGAKKTKQEAFKQTIDAFKSIQDEILRKTAELEELEKTQRLELEELDRLQKIPQRLSQREALKKTIEVFDLVHADLVRKTEEMEKQGIGKGVARDQLSRYLSGQKDILTEGFESLVRALPQKGQMMYFGLLLSSYSQQE